jgi:hypothetical protein
VDQCGCLDQEGREPEVCLGFGFGFITRDTRSATASQPQKDVGKAEKMRSATASHPQKDVGKAEKVKRAMTDLFKRIKFACSQVNISLGCWEESGDYDIEEAMLLKDCWLEKMTYATDEFSTYKDLVSVWANDELTRSGSNYAWLSNYLEDTRTCLDEAIANDAIEKLIKAKGQGNQYDEVSIVAECDDVPEEVCHDVPGMWPWRTATMSLWKKTVTWLMMRS